MSNSLFIQVAGIAAIAVVGTLYLAENSEKRETTLESAPVEAAAPHQIAKGSVVSIPRSNGQFYTYGRVNRGSVRFLVDTGASTVALTAQDALKSGIDPTTLRYDRAVDTANGRTYGAVVELDEIMIGGIRVRDVRAIVIPEGLGISLLGMSFLGELQKVEATPNQLILRH
ncbi:MAG: TIGR02281 family clan AA aspartic protease [Litorimonas sp.]